MADIQVIVIPYPKVSASLQAVLATSCTGHKLYRLQAVPATSCTGHKLLPATSSTGYKLLPATSCYRPQALPATSCYGYKLYRPQAVPAISCTGHKLLPATSCYRLGSVTLLQQEVEFSIEKDQVAQCVDNEDVLLCYGERSVLSRKSMLCVSHLFNPSCIWPCGAVPPRL